ncbi:hypothetical protein, partial [Escherichia coli]
WLMMSLWDALRMNMMISYQELVRTFHKIPKVVFLRFCLSLTRINTGSICIQLDKITGMQNETLYLSGRKIT